MSEDGRELDSGAVWDGDDLGVHTLEHNARRLRIRRARTAQARAAIGPIRPGLNLCIISHGQFSMVDVIQHVAAQIGPCHLDVVTWTVGNKDFEELRTMLDRGALLGCRLVVDRSLVTRDQANVERMVEAMGADNVRATQTHAKLTVLRNDRWAVGIRSSMNLNSNPRLEQVDLTESRELADFLSGFVDNVFDTVPAGLDNSKLPGGGTNDRMLAAGVRESRHADVVASAYRRRRRALRSPARYVGEPVADGARDGG